MRDATSTQRSLFDAEPTPPAVAPVSVATAPADRGQIRAASEAARALADATIGENAAVLSALRRAAAGYFHAAGGGKTYDRRPALKVTIPDPARTPDEPDARLVISPAYDTRYQGAGKAVTVREGDVNLTLCHLKPKGDKVEWHERLTVCLRDGLPTFLARCYTLTVADDAGRACGVAARFIADPAAAVAASGTSCVFCGRTLTDPGSRGRGIGPECFGRWGDFLSHITRAPEAGR